MKSASKLSALFGLCLNQELLNKYKEPILMRVPECQPFSDEFCKTKFESMTFNFNFIFRFPWKMNIDFQFLFSDFLGK